MRDSRYLVDHAMLKAVKGRVPLQPNNDCKRANNEETNMFAKHLKLFSHVKPETSTINSYTIRV